MLVKSKWPSAVMCINYLIPGQGWLAAFTWTGTYGWFTFGVGPDEDYEFRRTDFLMGVAHELAHAAPNGHAKEWRTVMIFISFQIYRGCSL